MRRWQDITPDDAVELDLSEPQNQDITAPLNEAGERCRWPWDPQQYTDVPMGMYHCPYCGAMVLAGQEHVDYAPLVWEARLFDALAAVLPPATYRALLAQAEEEGLPAAEVVYKALDAYLQQGPIDWSKITRVGVAPPWDPTAAPFQQHYREHWNVSVRPAVQDDGRTLKLFLSRPDPEEAS